MTAFSYLTEEERPFARELAIEATMRGNGGKIWPPKEPTKPGSVSLSVVRRA